jgi:betaine-aldehyde dehydrogenase
MTLSAQPVASHYIDGAYVEDTSGAEIPVIFAATGERIATLHAATPALVDRALAAAERAQRDWAKLTGRERGRILLRAAEIMRARNEDLSQLETLDTGKPIQETRVADATSGADAFEYFGGLAGSLTGEHIPLGPYAFT